MASTRVMQLHRGLVLVVALAACDGAGDGDRASGEGPPGCDPAIPFGTNGPRVPGFADTMSICVTDADTGDPAAGVRVTLDGGRVAYTDAQGRADVPGGGWTRAVTLGEPGASTLTWSGPIGNQIMLPFERDATAAQVRGEVAGWAELPPPAAGHYRIAEIQSSERPELTYRKNRLAQEVAGGVPANRCMRRAGDAATACTWRLATRPGLQRLIATIVDADDAGTPDDASDDTYEVTGYAMATSVALAPAEQLDGVVLAPVPAEGLVTMPIDLATGEATAGLDVTAELALQLGAEGRIVWRFPPITPASPPRPVLRTDDPNAYVLTVHAFDPADPASRGLTPRLFYAADAAPEFTYTAELPPYPLGSCGAACWTLAGGLRVARFDLDDGTARIQIENAPGWHVRPPPGAPPLGASAFEIVVISEYPEPGTDITPMQQASRAVASAHGSYAP
jgi:hypothetical protein